MSWPKLQRTTLCSGVIAEQRLRQRAVWVHSPPLAAHVQALISDDAKRQGQAYQKLRESRQLLSSEIPRRLRRGSFILCTGLLYHPGAPDGCEHELANLGRPG